MQPLNECSGCGKDFASLEPFDAHRLGEYPQTGPSEYVGPIEDWTPKKGRCCLTTEEMESLEKPFVQDGRGRWVLAHRQGRAQRAFARAA